MKLRKLIKSIETMPRAAYIFLRWNLIICCIMLALSLFFFYRYFAAPGLGRGCYLTASLLLENPAGLLMAGLVGMALLIDNSR